MNELKILRDQIDQIDQEFVYLFEKRMHLVRKIIQIKLMQNIDIYDKNREQQILLKNKALLKNKEYLPYYQYFLSHLLETSRLYQQHIMQKDNKNAYTYGVKFIYKKDFLAQLHYLFSCNQMVTKVLEEQNRFLISYKQCKNE